MPKITETDTYSPPTEKGIKLAIEHGIEEKWAKLGFDIFEDICGVFVRRLYYAYEAEKGRKSAPSKEACAKKAEELGLCKIIPVEKLPDYVPEDLREAIWIDTPENITKLEKYFSYRKILYK